MLEEGAVARRVFSCSFVHPMIEYCHSMLLLLGNRISNIETVVQKYGEHRHEN